jgi:hypothetical protein
MITGKVTYSEPSIQYLQHVLEMVSTGVLRIPRFQRPFVWLEDRQLELMRSIREGIPIGALMIWRTTDAPVTFYERLGNFPLNVNQNVSPQQYLLDGVQRITTLYGALADWRLALDSSADEIAGRVLYFNFEDNDFVFGEPDLFVDELMPMSIVFKTMELIKFQRNLANSGREEWIDIATELASRFKDYKIPLLSINTDDLSIATSTFQRVNTQGAKMSDFHMIHALTWTNEFDLQEELQGLKSEYLAPLLWSEVDDEIILKVCKGLRGLNLYKAEPKAISQLIREDRHLLKRAVLCVRDAAELLASQVHIPFPDLVPYAFQIIFIAIASEKRSWTSDQLRLIANWIWFTTYTEAFSGMSDDKVKRALSDFIFMIGTGETKWSNVIKKITLDTPKERFDFRSVRSKATILALARNYDGRLQSGFELLRTFGRSTITQLYTKGVSSAEANSPGNRVFISPAEATYFRECFEAGLLSAYDLSRHFIPQDSDSMYPEQVIRIRAQTIADHEADFAYPAIDLFVF